MRAKEQDGDPWVWSDEGECFAFHLPKCCVFPNFLLIISTTAASPFGSSSLHTPSLHVTNAKIDQAAPVDAHCLGVAQFLEYVQRARLSVGFIIENNLL
jgi:hypothetical protein